MSSRSMGYILIATLLLLTSSARTDAQLDVQKLSIERSRVTGLATFVTATNHDPLIVATKPTKGVQIVQGASALESIKKYGSLFGVSDATTQLALSSTKLDLLSRTITTFRQIHKGVPVFTGMLKVHEDFTGATLVVNGHFFPIPDKLDVVPSLDKAAAVKAAKLLMPNNEDVEQAKLVVVDPGWYGDASIGPRLAYHVILYTTATSSREAFFIDAHTAAMLDHWTMVYTVKDRRIYDGLGGNGLPGTLKRSEGGAVVGVPIDVDRAYDYYGDVYDYFSRGFGRDSLDGLGRPLVATVNSKALTCPNAGWSGFLAQMIFCDGTVTDDIVGHELAHGFTEFTSGLIYQNQSGQLNESVSDIFGELVDLFNGDAAFAGAPGGIAWPTHPTGPGVDTPNNLRTLGSCSFDPTYTDGVRWMIGEDAAIFGGAIRDMMNPPCFGDPDSANSDLQKCQTSDIGGVHIGSGVPNHAFALLTDGGTFNGVTVAGVGPIKSGAVWYRAQTSYWTPGTDFQDASIGLTQAALDLEGTFPNDPRTGNPSSSMFSASDTQSVIDALVATEMDTPGRCGGTRDVLDATPPAQCADQFAIFDEDFESGLGAWTVSNSAPMTPYDWVLTTSLPFGGDGLAAGNVAFIEDLVNPCPNAVVGGSFEFAFHRLDSPIINLPTILHFPTLKFDHVFMTEPLFDGGNISISVNGGAFQLIPATDFYYNTYNNTLFIGGNPLNQQQAFTDAGTHWGTSLVYLGNFVSGGDSIQIRFEFGKDGCGGALGWFVDNVRVYDCTTVQDCNNNNAPDELEPINSPPPNVVVQHPPTHSECLWADQATPTTEGARSVANRVQLMFEKTIEKIKIWGIYDLSNAPLAADSFIVAFRNETSGLPVFSTQLTSSVRQLSGFQMFGSFDEYEFTLTVPFPVTLSPGTYWIEIYNNSSSTAGATVFCWTRSLNTQSINSRAIALETPGVNWDFYATHDMALELIAEPLPIPADDWCADLDFDTYGDPNTLITACTQPFGFVMDCTDCDDGDNTANPGASEICSDGVDNDCNTLIDCDDLTSCAATPACIAPDPPALAAAPFDLPKVKYISIDASVNGTQPLAIRIVELTTGKVKWAGAPTNGLSVTDKSELASAPVVMDWSSYSTLHLTGCIIQPFGNYEISFVVDPFGVAISSTVLNASTTCDWGDVQVVAGPCDVGIGDIVESINIVTGAGLFPKPHADLQGDVANGDLDIGDIVATINGAVAAPGTTPVGYTALSSCP